MIKAVRAPGNPIITPQDIMPSRHGYEVICAFNAGVAKLGHEVVLLVRVAERPINRDTTSYSAPVFDPVKKEMKILSFDRKYKEYDFSDSREIVTPVQRYLTSISHLRVARSIDGIHFKIEEKPSIFPENQYETFGIEDPRISLIDGIYYIAYSAISELGITGYLVSTKDFISFERRGVIFCPDNKDVEIFPEKINGRYYALHRPSTSRFGKPEIWIAESPDLLCWGNHRYVMGTREGFWDNGRVGGSAVPFRIDEGWLEIYHGADINNRYCLGAVLLDEKEPWKILKRSEKPILEPEAEYEVNGFFGNVIFNNGVLFENGLVKIYYGAADTYIGYAEIELDSILNSIK